MAQQEASGFRFDMDAAERVRARLEKEYSDIEGELKRIYLYVPGKVFTPKRRNATKGYHAGAPMTHLLEFNPTSRVHIAWALQNFRQARFTKLTETVSLRLMKPRYLKCVTLHCQWTNNNCTMNVKCSLGY